jgi:hypothetical protein
VWDGFKLHLGPEMTRIRDVDAVFHGTEYFINWCQEFEGELATAGVHDPRYWRARVRYVNELVTQFAAEDDEQMLGNFLRAETEALWSLGQQALAEERYEALIARLPNFAWGTSGWPIATGWIRSPRPNSSSMHVRRRSTGVPWRCRRCRTKARAGTEVQWWGPALRQRTGNAGRYMVLGARPERGRRRCSGLPCAGAH